MPAITRCMIKTSLAYFLLALLIGLFQALSALLPTAGWLQVLRGVEPTRIHILVIGWITMLIFGVAYWMFPKYSREKPRGTAGLGWASYGLLNAGLILRIISESAARPGTILGWLLVVSALLLWLAGAAFFVNTWPRIKEK